MPDFTDFKSNFTGDLVTPADPDYLVSIARWAANAQRRPKFVAFVRTADDVALAIAFSRANHLPIAIRGGGHNPAGTSSIEGGVVIDLSRHLNHAKVDPEKKLAYVGGGALWETVDKEAIKHGLATVTGTVNHTGVGGLTLGGGYGWLTGRHGLAIDNLVQATIVTASGSIVTTSATSHPDLFFAIRGGGSNFGVVIEFVFKLHPQRPTVYGGLLYFALPALEQSVDVTNEWWANVGKDEAMQQFALISRDGNPAIVLCLFYNGSEAEGRANYKRFFDIGPVVDQTREMPFEELNTVHNPFVVPGRCVYMKGFAHRGPDHPSILEAFTRVIAVNAQQRTPQIRLGFLFEYFPLSKINSVPRGTTAFLRNEESNGIILVSWTPAAAPGMPEALDLGEMEKGNTDEVGGMAEELVGILLSGQNPGASKGEELGLGYLNYDPDAGSQGDKASVAFGENYQRLREVKRVYDPDGVFNKWFPIAPA